MAPIRVIPDDLRAIAAQLNVGVGSIEETLSQLATQVESLSSDWAGLGAQSFEHLWQQWQASSRQLHSALDQMAGLLRAAATNYETADVSVTSAFRP